MCVQTYLQPVLRIPTVSVMVGLFADPKAAYLTRTFFKVKVVSP